MGTATNLSGAFAAALTVNAACSKHAAAPLRTGAMTNYPSQYPVKQEPVEPRPVQ
jgi:hypothetical protein